MDHTIAELSIYGARPICTVLFGGIISPSDATELDFLLLARSLWRPGSVKPNCVAT
jgi:hypothetical protein